MTVSTTSAVSGPYAANGVTTVFPFTFKAMDAGEVRVTIAVGGIETEQDPGLYTSTLNSGGGSITFVTAPTSGDIYVYSEPSYTQETEIISGQSFSPRVIGDALDRAVVRDQDILRRVNAALDALDAGILGDIRSDLISSTGAGLVSFSPTAIYEDGVVGAKLQQIKAVADYATPAIADALDLTLYSSVDAASTVANGSSLVSRYWGPGQITTADGNKRGPWFSRVAAIPDSFGNWDSIETAFNGDLSKTQIAMEHRIGAGAVTVPATGYAYTPEAAADVRYFKNLGGGNTSTSSNDGRSSANLNFWKVDNYGGGDCPALSIQGYLAGIGPVGATSWLAMPAITMMNGTFTLGMHGGYLNPFEVDLQMGAFDGAAVGFVVNINRSVGDTVNGLGAPAIGFKAQSKGTYALDAAFSLNGLFKGGLDLTPATWTAAKAGILMSDQTRIYGNASSSNGSWADSLGDDYFSFTASINAWNFVVNGNSNFQIASQQVTFVKPPVLPSVSTSGLPAAAPANKGMEYYVSDANATTRLSTVVGGGANFVKVFSNGTNWLIQ